MTRKFLWRVGLAAATLAAAMPAQLTVPLPITISNLAPTARTNEPVTFGFPVPQALGVNDPSVFRILGPGQQPLPAQFRALARWGGARDVATRPLRWVQATVAANVPANGSLVVEVVGSGPGPVGSLLVATTATSFTITTGPGTSFVVPRSTFALPSSVVVSGQTVVSAPGALEIIASNGAPMAVVPTSTELEESGSVRAVIRQRGSLGDLRYTLRLSFHAGRSDVAVEFRLENPMAYALFMPGTTPTQRYFDRLTLKIPVPGTSLTVTSPSGIRTVTSGSSYELRQSFAWGPNNADVLAGFSFAELLNGTTVATGSRAEGALDVSNQGRGVCVAVERLWQQFPKALRVQNGAVHVDLWPSFGNGPLFVGQYASPGSAPPDPQALTAYRFEGGRWKTHRVVLDFHATAAKAPADVVAFAGRVNAPLTGIASARRIGMSGALGHVFLDRRASYPSPSFDRLEQFHGIMVDDERADPIPTHGKVGLARFKTRGGTYGGWQSFGWENFGDLPWIDGYCDLHYDWPGSLLLAYVRTGDARFFDRGREMAQFRRDYGQNHGQDAAEYWRGAQFYEKGYWHGNDFPGAASHNWLLGLGLHYVLTGDEGSYEAARENVAFLLRSPPGQWSGYWGSRIPGWSIEALLDAHALLGEPGALAAAGAGVARFEQLEVQGGAHGYHLDPGSAPPDTAPWMDNIFFNAAARYALTSGDRSHDAFLHRMRTWFLNDCLAPASGTASSLNLPAVARTWSPGNPGAPSLHLAWPMAESLSWSALLFNDRGDLDQATVLFECLARYWQGSLGGAPVNGLNPATWSPVTFRPTGYPVTESKILGNVLIWSRAHPAVRAYFEGWL